MPVKNVVLQEFPVRLPIHIVAHIRALAETYPEHSENGIIVDLLSAALDEFLASLPYVKGKHVPRSDDFGDPVYEDGGPTPRFIELAKKHTRILEAELSKND